MQFLVLLGIFFGYILLAAGVTVLLVKLAGRMGAQRTGKRVVAGLGALTFVLIPTWDFIPGRLHFKQLCQTEAGLKIYKMVEGVDGLLLDRKRGKRDAEEFLGLGYRFIETTDYVDNKRYRYARGANGAITQEQIERFISRYAWVNNHWQQLPWDIVKGEYAVVDLQTQQRIAEFKEFYYNGNWALKRIGQEFSDPCPGVVKPHLFDDFLLKTLRPVAVRK